MDITAVTLKANAHAFAYICMGRFRRCARFFCDGPALAAKISIEPENIAFILQVGIGCAKICKIYALEIGENVVLNIYFLEVFPVSELKFLNINKWQVKI